MFSSRWETPPWVYVQTYEEWKRQTPEQRQVIDLAAELYERALKDQRGLWRSC